MKTFPAWFAREPFDSRFRRRFVAASLLVVSIFSLTARAQQPPAPWQSADIGDTAAGTTNYNSSTGVFTIEGGGDDIWGTADHFRYVYQTVTGDFSITAKVESVENTYAWAKAGVMIRDGTNPGEPYAFAFMTPSTTNGGKFEYRSSGSSATGGAFDNTALPRWVRVTRAGNTFTAAQSVDGSTWNPIGTPQTIAMPSSVQIGLAVCSSVTNTLCTATFSNVSVSNGL
ncbi:MAG TPA: hypothetical protein VEA63_15920, partial [Opitutus sp.]|nr:hypothetical protein [Opitutus sp.]